jgi:hypothetical protein
MTFRKSLFDELRLLALVTFIVSSAQAQLTFVDDSSLLEPNDLISWSSLGPDGTQVATPFAIDSFLELSTTVTKSGDGLVQKLTQGVSSWNGNFPAGTPVLYTTATGGSITLEFNSLVSGVGASIQPKDNTTSFGATITALDSAGQVLLAQSVAGGTFTPVFVGFLSESGPIIDKVRFELTEPTRDFGIGYVALVNPVPEPSSYAIAFGLGLIAFAVGRRRIYRLPSIA